VSDDPIRRGHPDRDRINVHQEHELRYWSERFGVTPDQLKAAVRAVGPHVSAVEQKLKRTH
jgi:hypothetical protein